MSRPAPAATTRWCCGAPDPRRGSSSTSTTRARGLLLAAERLETSEPVNLGTGRETTIRELAEQIERIVGYEGETVWDATRPDGQPRRFLDVARARDLMGFEARVPLDEGLRRTVESFKATAPATR